MIHERANIGSSEHEMLVRAKHVHTVRSKGRVYRYHRVTGERLPNNPAEAATRALEINRDLRAGRRDEAEYGTLAHLMGQYRTSPEFLSLSPRSRKDYDRYLTWLSDHYGGEPVQELNRPFVFAVRDLLQDRPRTANYTLQVLRRVLNYALDRGLVDHNPAARPRLFAQGKGHKPWPTAAIERFREHAEREVIWAFELALATGQRQADCLAALWSHYDGEGIEVVQSKTSARVWVPVHPSLKRTLEEIPRRAAVILTTKTGRPWQADHFRHVFHRNVVDCGLSGLTFHGLRHTAATRLADVGCSTREIMSITGHKTEAMVSHYTREADQKRHARSAMGKLARRTKQG